MKAVWALLAGSVMVWTLLFIVWPWFAGSPKQPAMRTAALSNMKRLGHSLVLYSQDSDGRFPPVDRWNDVVAPVLMAEDPRVEIDRLLRLKYDDNTTLSAAMNAFLDQAKPVEDDGSTVLLVQVDSKGRNLCGGPADAWDGYGGDHKVAVGFTDGRAKQTPGRLLGQLRWRPRTK